MNSGGYGLLSGLLLDDRISMLAVKSAKKEKF